MTVLNAWLVRCIARVNAARKRGEITEIQQITLMRCLLAEYGGQP